MWGFLVTQFLHKVTFKAAQCGKLKKEGFQVSCTSLKEMIKDEVPASSLSPYLVLQIFFRNFHSPKAL